MILKTLLENFQTYLSPHVEELLTESPKKNNGVANEASDEIDDVQEGRASDLFI